LKFLKLPKADPVSLCVFFFFLSQFCQIKIAQTILHTTATLKLCGISVEEIMDLFKEK